MAAAQIVAESQRIPAWTVEMDDSMSEWHAALSTPAARPTSLSRHACRRAARRNVARAAVEYVIAHGRAIQRTGVTFYFLGRRDMPHADRGASWASRLEGTVVLVASDGEVITVYRNRGALRMIQRKLKHRSRDLNWQPEAADVGGATLLELATA
jgi:hypothetical protein